MADVCVACSGPLLSSLIFKLKNARGDAEGFLFGEVRECRIENITDSQSAGVKEELSIFIQGFHCCGQRFSFYDHLGRPDFDRIEALLGPDIEHVIGWFSYRRNTSHQISMRERAIHDRLMTSFGNIASRYFLFGLITEQLLEQSEVHSTLYTFHNCIGTSPQLTKCDVVNLGHSVAVPYQHLPPTPLHLSTVIQQHRHFFQDSAGQMLQMQAIDNLYKAVISKLDPLRAELKLSTAEMIALGEEVTALQKEVDDLRDEENENEDVKSSELQEKFDDRVKSATDYLIDFDGLQPEAVERSPSLSHDLVCNSPDPSSQVEDYVLEPELLTSSGNHRNGAVDIQSQELF